jgi:transcriptional regulator with XRE-family HTH domain
MAPRESPAEAEAVFAENLKALRKAAGMSQEEFARAMTRRGVKWHQATVYKVEKGERQIQLGEADVAARVLNVPLQEMLRANTEAAVQRQRLRLRTWRLVDARLKLVDAVHDYDSARSELATALDDAAGLLSAEECEQLRRHANLEAIHDFAELKRMTNPQHEEAES